MIFNAFSFVDCFAMGSTKSDMLQDAAAATQAVAEHLPASWASCSSWGCPKGLGPSGAQNKPRGCAAMRRSITDRQMAL